MGRGFDRKFFTHCKRSHPMKKKFAILLVTMATFAFSTPTQASQKQATNYLQEWRNIALRGGCQVIDTEAKLLSLGQAYGVQLNLKEGVEYGFVTAGCRDDGARQVNLFLNDANNQTLKWDTSTAHKKLIVFRPSYTGRYLIVTRLIKGTGKAYVATIAFCNSIAKAQPNKALAANNLELLANTARRYGRTIMKSQIKKLTQGGSFITKLNLQGGKTYLFATSGDANALEVDFYIFKGNLSAKQVVLHDENPARDKSNLFTPIFSGPYTILVGLGKSPPAGAYVDLLILQ